VSDSSADLTTLSLLALEFDTGINVPLSHEPLKTVRGAGIAKTLAAQVLKIEALERENAELRGEQ